MLVIDTFDAAAPKLESFFLRLEEGGRTSVGFVLFQGFLSTPTSASTRGTAAGTRRQGPSSPSACEMKPTVTVVGLGPGGEGQVTAETLAAIERIAHRFLRTTRHPSAHLVGAPTSFDDVYEAADRFADVYAEIVERLVAGAAEHGEILYAVPGSPLVLERTVQVLRADERVRCDVLPAMSFLDVAWAASASTPSKPACASSTGTSSPAPPAASTARC